MPDDARPTPPPNPLDRRDFLRASAIAALASAGVAGAAQRAAAEPRPSAPPSGRARNLIFMVADGMSSGVLSLCDLHCRLGHGRRSHWTSLMNAPGARNAQVETGASNGPVPDSASTASAWSIGERIEIGAICWTPDGRSPTPLFVRARGAGRAIGLVSTTRLTDATPAAFVANAPLRTMEAEIGEQLIDRSVDLMLGAGSRYFPEPLLARREGLVVVRDRAGLLGLSATSPAQVLGLFADENMAFALERPAEQPTIAEMTAAAIANLSARPDGFALMVEGGRVDHAAHYNDAAALIHEQFAFEEALKIARDFTDSRDDTLLIATADHANANPGLATHTKDAAQRFAGLFEARRSFEAIFAGLDGDQRTGAAVAAALRDANAITLSDDEVAVLDRWLSGRPVDPYLRANEHYSPLGSVVANHCGVAFVGPDHTTDFVQCTALGPGSAALRPAIANTELNALIVEALGLT